MMSQLMQFSYAIFLVNVWIFEYICLFLLLVLFSKKFWAQQWAMITETNKKICSYCFVSMYVVLFKTIRQLEHRYSLLSLHVNFTNTISNFCPFSSYNDLVCFVVP